MPWGIELPYSWQMDRAKLQNQELQRQNALLQQDAFRQQAYDVQQTRNALTDYWQQYGDYRRQQGEARAAYEAEPSAEPAATMPEFRPPRNSYEAAALQQVQQGLQQQSALTYNTFSPVLQQIYNGDITNPEAQQALANTFSKDPYLAPLGTILKNATFTKPRTFEVPFDTQNPRSMAALKQWVGPENAWQLDSVPQGAILEISGRQGSADVKQIKPGKEEKPTKADVSQKYTTREGKPLIYDPYAEPGKQFTDMTGRLVSPDDVKLMPTAKERGAGAGAGAGDGAGEIKPNASTDRQVKQGYYDKMPAKSIQQNKDGVHAQLLEYYKDDPDKDSKVTEAEQVMERNSGITAQEKKMGSAALAARSSIDKVLIPKMEAWIKSRQFDVDRKKLGGLIRSSTITDKGRSWFENWVQEQRLSPEGRAYAVAAFDAIRQVNQSVATRGGAQKSLDLEHQFFNPASSAQQLRVTAETEREIVDTAASTYGIRPLPKRASDEAKEEAKKKREETDKAIRIRNRAARIAVARSKVDATRTLVAEKMPVEDIMEAIKAAGITGDAMWKLMADAGVK